jgi:hypothetical protein
VVPSVPAPVALQPERLGSSSRPPTTPAVTVAPTPTPGPVAAAAAPATGAAGTAPAATVVARDEEDVRTVLSRYRDGYERLDAHAVKQVWPSLNQSALARAFEGLESQDVVFSACRLNVAGNRAEASCSGLTTYVQRVGNKSPQSNSREWTFKLRKDSNAWAIASVETR